MYNNEINLLTAFYELLLTQSIPKKQKYMREKKRKLYEAKNHLKIKKKSEKRIIIIGSSTGISTVRKNHVKFEYSIQ